MQVSGKAHASHMEGSGLSRQQQTEKRQHYPFDVLETCADVLPFLTLAICVYFPQPS